MLKSTLSLFLFSCLLGLQDCTDLTVKRGADATLECSGPKDANIIMLKWEKPDLSEGHVIVIREGQFQEELQHESFKGRIELKDPKWNKTGDFSVILKNVTMNDAGLYKCYAGYGGQEPKLLSNITLKVEKPGQTEEQNKDGGNINGGTNGEEKKDVGKKDGSVGLTVGVIVGVLLLAPAVIGLVYFCRKNCKNSSTQHEPAPQQQEHAEDALQQQEHAEDAENALQQEEHAEDAEIAPLVEQKADEHADMNSDSHWHAPMKEEQGGRKEEEHEMSERPSELN